MTNEDIIMREALEHNIFTPEEIEKYVSKGISIPLHTFNTWREMGYKIKKGEKGLSTHLWKYKSSKETKEDDSNQSEGYCYYLAKAYLFSIFQVEKVVSQ